MIFIPLITVLVVSALTLMVTGPIIQGVANGIAVFITFKSSFLDLIATANTAAPWAIIDEQIIAFNALSPVPAIC